jgi:hypothetical protein
MGGFLGGCSTELEKTNHTLPVHVVAFMLMKLFNQAW